MNYIRRETNKDCSKPSFMSYCKFCIRIMKIIINKLAQNTHKTKLC